MQVEYVELEGKEYIITEKLLINNIRYYVLATEEKEVCIRKEKIEDGEKYLVGLDDEAEFNLVLEKYMKKATKPSVNCLPIGSIISLHDCNFYVMITGYSMKNQNGEVYDYCGCRYPIGLLDNKNLLCFDRENIVGIRKMGYIDDEAKEFLEKIESTYYN